VLGIRSARRLNTLHKELYNIYISRSNARLRQLINRLLNVQGTESDDITHDPVLLFRFIALKRKSKLHLFRCVVLQRAAVQQAAQQVGRSSGVSALFRLDYFSERL